ncbi:hypothetical protein ACIQH6_14650 [Micromonospora orduensis]|uniref:hypothetical protein n=1 Tax=Micromonospora orduensis TaxID=1420891 RepID=UPI0038072293
MTPASVLARLGSVPSRLRAEVPTLAAGPLLCFNPRNGRRPVSGRHVLRPLKQSKGADGVTRPGRRAATARAVATARSVRAWKEYV